MIDVAESPPQFRINTCPQCKDAYTWLAVYNDNTALPECSGTGIHAAFSHINLNKLDAMLMIPLRQGFPQVAIRITDQTMRPIFFRRRLIELNFTGDSRPGGTIHCLGWQKNLRDGTNVESFTFIFEDGSIIISDDRNAV